MFANGLSYFCTITLGAITTIITYSTFIHVKELYILLSNNVIFIEKKIYVDKFIQTDIITDMNNVEIQTDIITDETGSSVIGNSFIKIDYINDNITTKDSLENLMMLAKNQMIIENTPFNYKWVV